MATEEGLPTGFKYELGTYGPFCREIRPVMSGMLDNGLITEEQKERKFNLRVGPAFDDVKKKISRQIAAVGADH